MDNEKKISQTNEILMENIKRLIAGKDEINLEWLKAVTQAPPALISKIIIQELGMVVLDGRIYSKEKAERRLQQMQDTARSQVDREAFRKGAVEIDMMTLREKLWTARFPERILGQQRHQFCPIWNFLEGQSSSIILRYDWLTRFEKYLSDNSFKKITVYELEELINELGENFKGKAKVVFAKTNPRDTVFNKDTSLWVLFLVSLSDSGIRLEGLDMVNILTISTKFKSRELAYKALNEYIELVNFIVSDPTIFEEIIVGT
ncbi:MAG TPA: hypothetical protein VMX55_07325 [candidate division Zixibacteria bacterium]|nr:hypothetical protein [candidate division Zixibacteria bacterium]